MLKMDYSADAIQNRTSRETKNSPLKQESISTALLPLENKPEKSNNSLTLFKLAMIFYGISSLLPNSAILTDMDYFINRVKFIIEEFYLASKSSP